MDHDAAEKLDREKFHIRAHVKHNVITDFRFYGVSIAEMGRPELLGVICFLIEHPHAYVRDMVRETTG